MAAGISRQEKTARAYNHLQAIRRTLQRAGVETKYVKATARTRGCVIPINQPDHVDGGFNISMEWGSMSNGESVGTVRLYLVLRGETKVYAGFGYNCDGSYSTGLDIVKREFSQGVL
jgi:hypothetical protein